MDFFFNEMSRCVKRNANGRYYTAGLSKMTSLSFKVAKKAIMYISGRIDSLHKPSGHRYSSKG